MNGKKILSDNIAKAREAIEKWPETKRTAYRWSVSSGTDYALKYEYSRKGTEEFKFPPEKQKKK